MLQKPRFDFLRNFF